MDHLRSVFSLLNVVSCTCVQHDICECSYLCWLPPHVPVHLETSEWTRGSFHTFRPGNEEVSCSDRWILCLGAEKYGEKKKGEGGFPSVIYLTDTQFSAQSVHTPTDLHQYGHLDQLNEQNAAFLHLT